MYFMQIKQLKKGEFLYGTEDDCSKTYFMFHGKIELIVKSKGSDEFKFSKQIDEHDFFGHKLSTKENRADHARVVSEDAKVILFDSQAYLDIISKTQLSTGDLKVDFLYQYIPKLRKIVPRTMIEDFEVYFMKEQVTRGYVI